jgi:hypothetical protein
MRFLLVLLALTASAADISGNWKGVAETANGTLERTFMFKVDGTKVTGETNSPMFGKSTINDGKIEGENLTFTVTINFQGNETKVNYKGKVNPNGNEIRITAETQDGGFSFQYLAKRVS